METIVNVLSWLFMIGVVIAIFSVGTDEARAFRRQEQVLLHGEEVDAEILGRFEFGEPQGTAEARRRRPYLAPYDPRELELRYLFRGREIVSRCRVPIDTYMATKAMKSVTIRVDPQHPEQWAALA